MSCSTNGSIPTTCGNCGWTGELELWMGCPTCGAGGSAVRPADIKTVERLEAARIRGLRVASAPPRRIPHRVIPRVKDRTEAANRARKDQQAERARRAREMRYQGYTHAKIATTLGVHPRTVGRLLAKSEGPAPK